MNKEKKCSVCGIVKTVSDFFKSGSQKNGKLKLRADCKECSKLSTSNWRQKNKSHYNNYVAMWRAKNPERQHKAEIKRRYGLSIEDYNSILIRQKMKCVICSKQHDPSLSRGRLYVDHCHKTGVVRALLCGACNSMIGYANDSSEILEKAITYLKSYS